MAIFMSTKEITAESLKAGIIRLKHRERSRKWVQNNREKHRESARRYTRTHKEETKKRNSKQYWGNPEKHRKRKLKYYRDNPEKIRERTRKWYKTNREKVLKKTKTEEYKSNMRRRRHNTKIEVLSHYSNGVLDCACCGENRIEFLTIDHLNGGGRKHRKELRAIGSEIYPWLKRNNYPPGFRVLCMNCNFAFGQCGYCSHEAESS